MAASAPEPYYYERARGKQVPAQWTLNQGRTLRELEVGMDICYRGDRGEPSPEVFRVVSASPCGAYIQSSKKVEVRIKKAAAVGGEDPERTFTATQGRGVVISLTSCVFYRRGDNVAKRKVASSKSKYGGAASMPTYAPVASPVAQMPDGYVEPSVASMDPEKMEDDTVVLKVGPFKITAKVTKRSKDGKHIEAQTTDVEEVVDVKSKAKAGAKRSKQDPSSKAGRRGAKKAPTTRHRGGAKSATRRKPPRPVKAVAKKSKPAKARARTVVRAKVKVKPKTKAPAKKSVSTGLNTAAERRRLAKIAANRAAAAKKAKKKSKRGR